MAKVAEDAALVRAYRCRDTVVQATFSSNIRWNLGVLGEEC